MQCGSEVKAAEGTTLPSRLHCAAAQKWDLCPEESCQSAVAFVSAVQLCDHDHGSL